MFIKGAILRTDWHGKPKTKTNTMKERTISIPDWLLCEFHVFYNTYFIKRTNKIFDCEYALVQIIAFSQA